MEEFVIPSMSCGGCASRITKVISKLDASVRVEVDVLTKKVRVESSQSRALIATALKDAGYAPNESPPVAQPVRVVAASAAPVRGGCCCG